MTTSAAALRPHRYLQCSVIAAAALWLVQSAFAANPNSGHPPKVLPIDGGTGMTPLARMVSKSVDDKLDRSPLAKCKEAKGPNKPKGKKSTLASDCGIPGMDVTLDATDGTCPDCGNRPLSDASGKVVGHVVKNKVAVHFENPAQRGLANWPDFKMDPERMLSTIEDNTRDPDPNDGPVGVRFTRHPSKADATFDCAANGGTPTANGCDLNRAMVKKVNAKAALEGKGKGAKKKKAFHATDDGECIATPPTDSEDDGAVPCGGERRVQKLTESYAIVCPVGFEYADGRCRKEDGTPVAKMAKAALPAPGVRSQPGAAMMGFTFAPPIVEWGFGYSEEVCIDLLFDEFCFTIFSAEIGYEFELAVGLRLPVNLSVDEIPTPAILAGRSATIRPKLTSKDYSYDEYVKFCNDNNLADGSIIANCTDRFGFPEFFSSKLNSVFPSVPIDGKEFIAQATVKAGVFVEVFEIPIVSIGVNSAMDFATACSLLKFREANPFGFIDFADPANSLDVLASLKREGINCASFETPLGYERTLTGGLALKTFPFTKSFHLPADCSGASKIKVKGKDYPICSGLALYYAGASLGIGMDIELGIGSKRIEADFSTSGDTLATGGAIAFEAISGSEALTVPFVGPVTFDNYAGGSMDTGTVQIDDFTYCLNAFGIQLGANLEFGGILSVLPALPTIPILNLSFDAGGCGIPLPQHPGSKPVTVEVPVTNFALSIDATPASLAIKPGDVGTYAIRATNLGSVTDDIFNFSRVLPDAVAANNLPAGWTSTPDVAPLFGTAVNLPKHTQGAAAQDVLVGVAPLRHPLTRPGAYPIVFRADSRGARDNGMSARDPLLQARYDAERTVSVTILAFFEPRLEVTPMASRGKPGAAAQAYVMHIENFGNTLDNISLANLFADSNGAACTLTTLGGAGCPFRSVPTIVPSGAWTTAAGLKPAFSLIPTGIDTTSFQIGVPADWAGMGDTEYRFTVTTTSGADPDTPKAKSQKTVVQTVIATKQSMTRYIGLQLEELAQQIVAANNGGIKTGGALPIITNAVQGAHGRALASILAGNLGGASGSLSTATSQMAAFVKAINGPGIPAALVSDWTARAAAITRDLGLAEASMVASQ